jgi:hypothetical protein
VRLSQTALLSGAVCRLLLLLLLLLLLSQVLYA